MRNNKRNLVKSDFSPVFRHFVNVLINRVKVNNLPEEINEKFLLYHVLLYGRVLFFEKNGKYHVMWFSGKGKLNEYYIQKEFLVVNPWADETSDDYTESNAAILFSDMNAYIENADVGLFDLIHSYAQVVNNIDASIRALAKNSKVIAFITGSTNSFVSSAKQMLKHLFDSEECIGVMEESLVDAIRVNPISEKMDYKFSELIKARQYYISDFYQKLGISANMNMKAERLTDNESQLIDSVSDVDFENIIDNLNYSVSFINEKFGLDISFEINEKKSDPNILTSPEDTDVVDNMDVGDDDGNSGNASQENDERNTASQNELSVQGDGYGVSDTGSENIKSSDGSPDTSGITGEEDQDNKIEIDINIETKDGDINVEDDKSVVDNTESESEEKETEDEEKEDETKKESDE